MIEEDRNKKITVLCLVLMAASVASATFALTGDGTSIGSIVGTDNTPDYEIVIMMLTTGGTVDDGTIMYTDGWCLLEDTEDIRNHTGSEFDTILAI